MRHCCAPVLLGSDRSHARQFHDAGPLCLPLGARMRFRRGLGLKVASLYVCTGVNSQCTLTIAVQTILGLAVLQVACFRAEGSHHEVLAANLDDRSFLKVPADEQGQVQLMFLHCSARHRK